MNKELIEKLKSASDYIKGRTQGISVTLKYEEFEFLLKALSQQSEQVVAEELIINELNLLRTYFDVSKLTVKEQSHHIRFTSIIVDRLNHYNQFLKEKEGK